MFRSLDIPFYASLIILIFASPLIGQAKPTDAHPKADPHPKTSIQPNVELQSSAEVPSNIEGVKKDAEEKNKDNPFQNQIIRNVPQPPTDYERSAKAVEEMLMALRAYDASKAYYVTTSKEFRKAVSLEDFKNLVKRFSVLSRNRIFQIDQPDFKGNNLISLYGRLISTDGDAMKASFDLVLEDGEWTILNIQLTQIQTRKKQPARTH